MFIILPVAAETPLQEVPRATYGLLAALCLIWFILFVYWVGETFADFQAGSRDAVIRLFAYTGNNPHPWSYLTSSLVHTNVFHLILNLIFLWLFGCYVEERLGWRRYVLLLMSGAVAGSWAYSWGLWYYADYAGGAYSMTGADSLVTALFAAQLFLLPNLECRFLFVWLIHFMYQPVKDTITLPAIACIPIWLSLKLGESYWMGDLSVASYTVPLGGFLAGAGIALWVRYLPRSRILEHSRQRLEEIQLRKQVKLDYRNFQSALKADVPKAAFEIYRRTRKTENSLPVTTGERMDLANQLPVLGDVLAAGSVYRDVLRTENDVNVTFEAGLRLSRIALHRLGDIQEAKDLLRNLYDRYKDHHRFGEVIDLIEQVKEVEGRPFRGTG